ncbi:protein translocase subunit SecDF [Croceimicrobium sp.]|uniref:protein translocase subunit SecDF n=1 Tax=Croceimicrobium sp. TaxID=2828340 RepID=UPI003BAABC10
MQNKGVIRLFAIVFALACIYQLSFTYITRSVESDADDYAAGDLERRESYLDSVRSEVVYNVLIDEFTYAEVKEKEINLGLDLRGGMNVILEVSVKDILREISNQSKDIVFTEAIKLADQNATENQENYLDNFFAAFKQINADRGGNLKMSDPKVFGTKEMNDKLGFNASDAEVEAELRAQVNASVENVYTVLRARIDQFGVVQPNIQRLDDGGRILVELPGVKDPDRVKKLLQSTAELEFYELYEGYELLNFMIQANERLRGLVENPNAGKDSATATQSGEEQGSDFLNEIQSVTDAATDSSSSDSTSAMAAAESDSLSSDSANVVNQFNPLWEVFGPNIDNETGQPNRGPIVGVSSVGDTDKVNEYLSNPRILALIPGSLRNVKFIWTAKPDDGGLLYLLAAKTTRDGKAAMSGDVVVDARQDFNQANEPVVTMSMNASGASRWAKITREAVGDQANPDDNRSVAVVLDNLAYSYPRVNNEISNGNTEIVGSFTVTEAQDLANILKAGALPAPARIIQADIVGPSLGKQAISAGLWSFVIALAIVMVYMIFYYNGAGAASDLALIVNMFFIFGVLASLGAVLTLPGIAGIVLTIGMAVDANVLIYERIREELTHGKGLRLAIEDGYKNAYSSIIDANVTTFLTGVILYAFGTGPIRGFATTLIIGILTSLFCAIFITRLVFEARLGAKKSVSFFTNATRNAFTKFNIDFLAKRKIAYTISGLIILTGIISLSTRGLNYGVDFVGGRSYQVRFDQAVNSVDIQTTLGDYFVNEDGTKVFPEVKTIGEASQVIITTKYKINETGTEVEADIKNRLYEGVSSFYQSAPSKEEFFSEASGASDIGIVAERQVGPTIADDIKSSAVLAIIFSLVVIFLYILIRFSKWQFSAGAVVAAFHDVLVVLSLFSLLYGILPFSLEIDQAFIAAVLTVIGYSLNDTVVVFDRIREYMRTHNLKKKGINEVVNDALNRTLSRTVNTSLTTFFVLLIIFIFGGEVIRGFMFALLIGIVVGTYSSLFIATPIMIDTMKKEEE